MASSDVEAVFAEDYYPPWMWWHKPQYVPPKPRFGRWNRRPVPVYTGTGRPIRPRFAVVSVKKSRW